MSLFDRAVVGALPLVPKPLVGWFGRRYIAGSRTEDAVAVVRELNARGMRATLDILGEHVETAEQARVPRDAYLALLDEIRRTGIDSNVSIKLTQLGLKVDPEACHQHLRDVLVRAAAHGNFVRIDMEDATCTDATLDIYRRLRGAGFENVGVVLQAMLRRTPDDAEELGRVRANIRLCKGIYVEPHEIAWTDRELVNRNFALTLERLFEAGCYVGIATHDERLVWEALRLIRHFRLERDAYEFQMLLGVREDLRTILVESGHRLRVYVPFGEQWYAYSVRRLRENPRIAGYVIKSLVRRNHNG